jgi:hypothetical protein
MREEGVFVTPSWEALLGCFETQNGQHLPLFWREPAKNSELMLLEMLQKDLKLLGNLLV